MVWVQLFKCSNPDCDWWGVLDEAKYVETHPAYNYGHNDCAPGEGDFYCPKCGHEIIEAEACTSCGDVVDAENIQGGECLSCRATTTLTPDFTDINTILTFAGRKNVK
jgi:hypothetical protein